MLRSSGSSPWVLPTLRHQRDGVLAQVVLHVIKEVRLDVAGEGTLEALVFEGLAWRTRNVMRLLGFSLLSGFHVVLKDRDKKALFWDITVKLALV